MQMKMKTKTNVMVKVKANPNASTKTFFQNRTFILSISIADIRVQSIATSLTAGISILWHWQSVQRSSLLNIEGGTTQCKDVGLMPSNRNKYTRHR
jgi:hypothetical protein